ncbi:MAG: DUF3795 domain-containing protein [Anaerolineae bacterium]
MGRLFGCCGNDCGACGAYIATCANDQEALERVAADWRHEYQNPSFTADTVRCDGCLSASTVHPEWCGQCPIRACGREHSVANCAACPDYGCAKIVDFTANNPQMRANLEALRRL